MTVDLSFRSRQPRTFSTRVTSILKKVVEKFHLPKIFLPLLAMTTEKMK